MRSDKLLPLLQVHLPLLQLLLQLLQHTVQLLQLSQRVSGKGVPQLRYSCCWKSSTCCSGRGVLTCSCRS